MFKKKSNSGSGSLSQKQIPTIVGLLILVVALIAGLLFFGEGTGVFAPRATPETTPQNIRITNLRHDSFTVSFFTQEAVPGFIKYGIDPGRINSQVRDDRDQLSGSVDDFQLHHITVRGLEPETDYYFVIGVGSRAEFDQEGQPFEVTTTSQVSAQQLPEAVTVFGSVALENGAPAQGSIVYVTAPGMQDMSSLVKGSGSWAIPLSQALNAQGTDYANLGDQDLITVLVQGLSLEKRLQHQLAVKNAQPVELVFGQELDLADQVLVEDEEEILEEEIAPQLDAVDLDEMQESDISGHLKDLLDEEEPLLIESSASAELLIGDLKTDPDEQVFTTQAPIIKGKVAPNVEVKIQVHSEAQYDEVVVANEEGEFELDLAVLGANLEPGEHTVTYSYTDPETGLEVVKTEFFWVEDPDKVTLAMADTTTTDDTSTTSESDPHGTGDPYPMPSPTPVPISTVDEEIDETQEATVATDPTREHIISTESGVYKAGSIGATSLLIVSGIFFILIGSWSWWLAGELDDKS
jgi:hypothetical protein